MRFIQKIRNKLKNKEFAVFLTSNGKQDEIVKINESLTSEKFYLDNRIYLKNPDKYFCFKIKNNGLFIKKRIYYYYFYDKKRMTPLKLNNQDYDDGYNSKILYEILMTKKYYDLNQSPGMSLDFLKDPKILMFIIIGIIAIFYFSTGGTIQ